MATSITASTVSPFTGLLNQDVNFNVSASFPVVSLSTSASVVVGVFAVSASSPAIYYPNVDYPTVGQFIVKVYHGALTNTSNSAVITVGLQESNDNVTWNNIAAFSTGLVSSTDNGALATAANSMQVLLTPQAKPYLRAVATVPASGSSAGGVTGSFGIQTLF